jgi:hypothetical protein
MIAAELNDLVLASPDASWRRRAVVGLRYPRERFRLDVARCAALAADAHQEVAQTIVQPLDLRQHAHGRERGPRTAQRVESVVSCIVLYGSRRASCVTK